MRTKVLHVRCGYSRSSPIVLRPAEEFYKVGTHKQDGGLCGSGDWGLCQRIVS